MSGRHDASAAEMERIMEHRRPATSRPRIGNITGKWPLGFRLRMTMMQELNTSYLSDKEENMSTQNSLLRGWTVALAGTGINLALGVLYAWSIFKGAIVDSIKQGGEGAFNWEVSSANDPYAVACLAFAFSMIVAGKMQDKLGPKITCIIGGLMVGGGFILSSQSSNYWTWIIGFGFLVGSGMGFGYSAATPPALKWFPPAMTGLIAGIVVSGFGLASLYIAPLATYLLGQYGLQQSMLFFGLAFMVIVSVLALFISNPPAGYVPNLVDTTSAKTVAAKSTTNELRPRQLFGEGKFYVLWLCYFIGSGAGLMVIGSAKGMAKASMGEMAFLVVAIMSIGNAAGRLVAGVVSDKIGRANTLVIMLAFQAVLMLASIFVFQGNANPVVVVLLVTFMVFNYGTNLSLFPSFTKDLWGMTHFGMNYGLLFSAWGIGAFVLVRVSEVLKARTGDFTLSFAVAGILLLVGAMMASSLRPAKAAVPATATDLVEEEDMVLQKAGVE